MIRQLIETLLREDTGYLEDIGYNWDKTTDDFVTITSGDKTYDITKSDNKWKCSCTGFKYRGQCKHIDSLMAHGVIRRPDNRLPMSLVDSEVIPVIDPILSKYVDNWTDNIVGSYRRHKDSFKDIDIILPLSVEEFVQMGNELQNLNGFNVTVSGPDIIRGEFILDYNGEEIKIPLDIDRNNSESTSGIFLYRTGPKDLNTLMRYVAMSKGWSLSEHGLRDHVTGEMVNVPQETEEDIFNSLDIPYLTPKNRERWDVNLPVQQIRDDARRDYQNLLRSESGLFKEIADNIPDEVLTAIDNSKAKSKEDAIAYYLKKYVTPYIKYPYKGELLKIYDILINK